jgi:Predicted acetyltransferase
MNITYKVNTRVSPSDIADLRQSVGWNRMEDSYANPALVSHCHIACYAENSRLIGYADSVSNGVTDAYIQDVMVAPEYQNRGIGTELMKRMIAQLKEDNIYMISVIFEEKLLPFYSKFGFRKMMSGQMETSQLQ